jgi:hypothetical protein
MIRTTSRRRDKKKNDRILTQQSDQKGISFITNERRNFTVEFEHLLIDTFDFLFLFFINESNISFKGIHCIFDENPEGILSKT